MTLKERKTAEETRSDSMKMLETVRDNESSTS